MKSGKIVLFAVSFLLLAIVGVLGNVLAANFPTVPRPLLWIGGGAIIVAFVVVNVILVVVDTKQSVAVPQPSRRSRPQRRSHPSQANISHPSDAAQKPVQATNVIPTAVSPRTVTSGIPEEGQPTIEQPMLLCLAIDVSDSMKKPILDHTGKAIERWTSIHNALEHFVHLGVAWVKDPETQQVLPLYHLMAYGFGFKETMHGLGLRKTPGGAVRDLLAHPTLTSLPSAAQLSEHWKDYQNHLLSWKAYTGDLFGTTPMCQSLGVIRDRVKEECSRKSFTFPALLLIISDGLPDDGDPVPLVEELHAMGVMTLCCYLADRDVLAPRKLYDSEEAHWSDGARLLFQCASTIYSDNYVSLAMFDYLSDHGWNPFEGARLFTQVNQAEALGEFLEVLLRGTAHERRA
jgi:hypothetical protein